MEAVGYWWSGDASERYWLEATDRPDIGSDLRAPMADEADRPNWRYLLFQAARVGDVVFHYNKKVGAIIGLSTIAGSPRSQPIVWAARGTYARRKGTKPHSRPGYMIPLTDFQTLSTALTLSDIRARRGELLKLRDHLGQANKSKSLYFPFELSAQRQPRLLQGYASIAARLRGVVPAVTGCTY